MRDVSRQPVRLQGGHLVHGHHHDRVRPDGATQPRDVAHASAAQDPEVRPAQARPALQVVAGVQRLRGQGPHQGPAEEAQLRGVVAAQFYQRGSGSQTGEGFAVGVQG